MGKAEVERLKAEMTESKVDGRASRAMGKAEG